MATTSAWAACWLSLLTSQDGRSASSSVSRHMPGRRSVMARDSVGRKLKRWPRSVEGHWRRRVPRLRRGNHKVALSRVTQSSANQFELEGRRLAVGRGDDNAVSLVEDLGES